MFFRLTNVFTYFTCKIIQLTAHACVPDGVAVRKSSFFLVDQIICMYTLVYCSEYKSRNEKLLFIIIIVFFISQKTRVECVAAAAAVGDDNGTRYECMTRVSQHRNNLFRRRCGTLDLRFDLVTYTAISRLHFPSQYL
jgi:hypothetical protein